MKIETYFKKVDKKKYVVMDIPFFLIYSYLRTISSYRFRLSLEENYNCIVDGPDKSDFGHYYFNTIQDAEKAIDWINSMMLINEMSNNKDSMPEIVDIDFKGNSQEIKEYIKKRYETHG